MGSGYLKAACLLVGGAVFSPRGIPVLMSTGCPAGVVPGSEAYKLEGGFQNGAY